MKRKLIALAVLVGALALALGGCEAVSGIFTADVKDYFPLEEGAEWTFQGEVEIYGETTTQGGQATLYVAGTETIGGIETFELKVKDVTSINPLDDMTEVNEMLDGVSVFVAATEDGLEIFKVAVDQTFDVDEFFRLSATFSQGIPILPPYIFVGSTTEIDVEQSSADTWYDWDIYDATSTNSTDIEGEIIVVTDSDRREFAGKDYRGALATADVQTTITNGTEYDDPAETDELYTGTVSFDAEMFIARKLGFMSIVVEIGYGGDMTPGGPRKITFELIDTNVN